jgi:CubicO group peptidase (beta-lactamase class C family)
MRRTMTSFRTCILVGAAWLAACGGGDDGGAAPDAPGAPDAAPDAGDACPRAQLEAAITAKLDAALTDPDIAASQDVTVLLETDAGRRYTYNHGASTPTTVYESASTSKLVTATIIMDLVDQGELTLDTKASDLIPYWTDDAVTLRHLLAFTSGYAVEPTCIDNPFKTIASCVEDIWTTNEPSHAAAGTEFDYSGTHMQVAGLMAMTATSSTTWGQIFDAWRARTGLFPTGAYDLPSLANPRLAGGMHWTGEEYLDFLRALAHDEILTDTSRAALLANQRGAATVVGSPAFTQIHEDWAYGLGNWLECPTATTHDSFDCGAGHRNSSAGSYGGYPFIDYDHAYFGMVAQQGDRGTGFKGVLLLRAAQSEIEAWAALTCE